ncbi:MAG: 30S ribosomal protein S9 [Candidatus Nealsonbacteria bacterium DGGOD1a]|nr:MAG: 30S ribosomal protein S9 [Candidatus Nealsonbacteria bacterium DGGOD1a]
MDASGRKKTDKYYESIGRRKTAIARVRLYTRGDKIFLVNDKPFDQYFKTVEFKNIIEAPLVKMNCTDRFRVTALVKGGGINAQAEALRHGITRALVLFNADFKKRLKKSGYLTRDPRMKERKKPGLKKARRAPQWAKR